MAEERGFDLGGLAVRPAERAVLFHGTRHKLQPRVMQVLVALAKAREQVVSRDRLIELCWDGRIVGDDSLNRCILALRHLSQEFTPQPFTIETVPRVGHRLVVGDEAIPAPPRLRAPSKTFAIAGAFVLLLLAFGGYLLWHQRAAEPGPASIVVLPFRNLSSGDPYFAEGIGEEILGQLAREPQFRVAGHASSSAFGPSPDLRQVRSRLDVDYALEGSVRRQGDRVRVSANLVSTSDGTQLWSDSYDGKLDDIFAIQRQIGAKIATALQRKLVRLPKLSGPLVTKGEAYNLYLGARALIRSNNRAVGPAATDLLREALRIDPGYAPAWASLATAVAMEGALSNHETFIAAVRRGRAYARHAVSLAPEMAEGHGALGWSMGYGDPEGVAHLRRAAALDPNNSQRLLDYGGALSATGDFAGELAAYEQAFRIDPLWFRTTGVRAQAIAEMGDRARAEAIARRDLPDKGVNLHILLGRIAWIFGDYSKASRHWAIAAGTNSPRWGWVAKRTLHDATHAVGIETGTLEDIPYPPSDRSNWRVWMESAPDAKLWKQRNRDPVAADVYRRHNLVAAKLMLNQGRWNEIAAAYDSPAGLFGLAPGRKVRVDQLHEAPIVALALRKAGRLEESRRLLRESNTLVRRVYSRGPVPFWFDADAAQLFAVEGRTGEALDTLERAFRRGWRQNSDCSLRVIGEEPGFLSLHIEPRFKKLQALLAAHYAREREETRRLNLT